MKAAGLILLCLGSLAASVSFEAAAQEAVRAQVGRPLMQARNLAAAGEYKQALAIVEGLVGVPGKTAVEARVIGEMRQYVLTKMAMTPASPAQ